MNSKTALLFCVICCLISFTANAQNSVQESPTHKPMKDYGLKEYIYLSKDLPHTEDKPWRLVCQMPYNCHFQPWIRLKSKEGEIINLNSEDLITFMRYHKNHKIIPGNKPTKIYGFINMINSIPIIR